MIQSVFFGMAFMGFVALLKQYVCIGGNGQSQTCVAFCQLVNKINLQNMFYVVPVLLTDNILHQLMY